MPVTSAVTVKVPATTANLGSGFDCLGAALTLYNQFQFSLSNREVLQIIATGVEADRVSIDASNLVYQSFTHLYDHMGKTPPPVKIEITMEVPLARGLGSSATAIVAGLVGANCLAGSPLTQEQVLQLAIALEGHPDNVVPALLGGCRLAASGINDGWVICDIPWNQSIVPIVAIPNFELSTAEARRVLPNHYTRADAIFNVSHLGLLVRGLETGRSDWLKPALHDRIHQPYRQELIHGYELVQSAALNAGAHGMVISGAGPTLLALSDLASAEAVKSAMSNAWAGQGVNAHVELLQIDMQGAIVEQSF